MKNPRYPHPQHSSTASPPTEYHRYGNRRRNDHTLLRLLSRELESLNGLPSEDGDAWDSEFEPQKSGAEKYLGIQTLDPAVDKEYLHRVRRLGLVSGW